MINDFYNAVYAVKCDYVIRTVFTVTINFCASPLLCAK
jgi:hypothetical protein